MGYDVQAMKRKHVIAVGKAVQRLASLRGGGSALPGLVVEKLDRSFVSHVLGGLKEGVVLITGTNGKTTTTKMIAEILRGSGKKVFTNPTGSNFSRGVAAALLRQINSSGHLDADLAVLELDEAHAVAFARRLPPRCVLVLNIMRDQLDRFGEIDHTARLLSKVVASASQCAVLNRDDARVFSLPAASDAGRRLEIRYFGADDSLRGLFVSDDELHGDDLKAPGGRLPQAERPPLRPGDVILQSADQDNKAVYHIGKTSYPARLRLGGVYNLLNAAGALAVCRWLLGSDTSPAALIELLEKVGPAFGRGETVLVNGRPIELVLVKNPAGFRLSLAAKRRPGAAVMIAVNDRFADGRDMSWLWDVDFSGLHDDGVQMISGLRAYDMALRLQYDEVTVGRIEPNLTRATSQFAESLPGSGGYIYCTYSAMLAIRRRLGRYAPMEAVV